MFSPCRPSKAKQGENLKRDKVKVWLSSSTSQPIYNSQWNQLTDSENNMKNLKGAKLVGLG